MLDNRQAACWYTIVVVYRAKNDDNCVNVQILMDLTVGL